LSSVEKKFLNWVGTPYPPVGGLHRARREPGAAGAGASGGAMSQDTAPLSTTPLPSVSISKRDSAVRRSRRSTFNSMKRSAQPGGGGSSCHSIWTTR